MNVLELKGSIIERVAQLQDQILLTELDTIIKDFIESNEENWFENTSGDNSLPEQSPPQ